MFLQAEAAPGTLFRASAQPCICGRGKQPSHTSAAPSDLPRVLKEILEQSPETTRRMAEPAPRRPAVEIIGDVLTEEKT